MKYKGILTISLTAIFAVTGVYASPGGLASGDWVNKYFVDFDNDWHTPDQDTTATTANVQLLTKVAGARDANNNDKGYVESKYVTLGSNLSLSNGVLNATFTQTQQPDKDDGISANTSGVVNRFATSSTAAATTAKTANITAGTFTLEKGARVTVQFTYAHTGSTVPTLNINGTGAKAIYYNGAQLTNDNAKKLIKGVVDFVYDGTRWNLLGYHENDTNTQDGNTTYTHVANSPIVVTQPASGSTQGTIDVKYDGTTIKKNSNNQLYAVIPTQTDYTHTGAEGIEIDASRNVRVDLTPNTSGLTFDGTGDTATLKHSNQITAGTAGSTAATSGASISIPYVSYDAQGHITASGTRTHTVNVTDKDDGVTAASGVTNRYASSTTGASTAAKAANITTGTFNLEPGARVTVQFSAANTANTPTLNINGTGAKNIFHKGAQITSGANKALLAGAVDFVYDGTQYNLVGNYIDTNTQDGNEQMENGIATQVVAGSDANHKKTNVLYASDLSVNNNNQLTHTNTITAGTIGSSSASSGSTIAIPWATYDANGHITGKGTHTHTVTGFATTDTNTETKCPLGWAVVGDQCFYVLQSSNSQENTANTEIASSVLNVGAALPTTTQPTTN